METAKTGRAAWWKGAPRIWSPGTQARPIPALPESSGRWTALSGDSLRLAYFGADTRLFTVHGGRGQQVCGGKTVDQLLNLSQNEDIRDAHVLEVGDLLIFAPINVEKSTIRLFAFNPNTCVGRLLTTEAFPEDAQLLVVNSMIILQSPGNEWKTWTWRNGDFVSG